MVYLVDLYYLAGILICKFHLLLEGILVLDQACLLLNFQLIHYRIQPLKELICSKTEVGMEMGFIFLSLPPVLIGLSMLTLCGMEIV